MSSDPSVGLPDIDWPDQAIIAVDTGDANAVITSMVIHLSQDTPEDLIPQPGPFVPLFTYGPA